MANPQLEDGHTQIANELLEHMMKLHLSGNQWQILLCIIRKTYGFKKKVDYIANFQIQAATNLGKTVVSRTLRELQARNIISRNGKVSGLQKDWEHWEVSRIANPEKLAKSSTKLAILSTELAILSTKVSSPAVTQKKKETIQKKLYKRNYGEFNNVHLTDEEHQKLRDKLGSEADIWIEEVSRGKAAKGYKYKSDYAAILNWQRRDDGKARNPRTLPKSYTPTSDYPDL